MLRLIAETEESDSKYRGLLEAPPDAMLVANEDGEIVHLNLQVEKQERARAST